MMVASIRGCTGACVHAYTILNVISNQKVRPYVSSSASPSVVGGSAVHVVFRPHEELGAV